MAHEENPSAVREYRQVNCSVKLSLQQKRKPAILELKNLFPFQGEKDERALTQV